jgi:MSHA biogenesis protein MshJ
MRIDALTFRERLLLFLAAAAVLLAGLYVGLIEPSLKQQALARVTIETLTDELAGLHQQVAEAERASAADEAGDVTQTAAAIAAIEKDIEALQSRMMGPGEATRLLRALLAQRPQLTLLALTTEPPQPALPAPETDPAPQAAAPAAEPFFRHGITLRATGGYTDLAAYVEQLERLPWTVRWDSVRLDASQHPRIELTLKLDCISREPAWSQL